MHCISSWTFAGTQTALLDSGAKDDYQLDDSKHTSCRKDIGEPAGKIRHYSRGHVFIVRSCGHMDWWQPIYKYE